MPSYTYGDFLFIYNIIDATKEHHNKFIFNQEPDFYIASLSKLMDGTFTLLPKLFFDKMIKTDELSYQSCGSVIKSCKIEPKKKKWNQCMWQEKYGDIF